MKRAKAGTKITFFQGPWLQEQNLNSFSACKKSTQLFIAYEDIISSYRDHVNPGTTCGTY